jgi:iron complex transport system substrate-binding protein
MKARSLNQSLTRRGLLGAGALGALALSGCGGSGSSGSSSAGSTAAKGPGTHSVPTVMGAVDVPMHPTRVVSVHPLTVDALYDFAADPIGVYEVGAANISPRYRSRWEKATPIGADGQLDLATVASLEPDLIIGADYEWNTNYYRELSKLAPTVVAPSTEWRDAAHTIADAVGRFETLAAMQKELAQRSSEIQGAFAKQLDAYRWDLIQGGVEGGEYRLYGRQSGPGGVLTAAGVRLAPGSAGVTGGEDESLSSVGVTGGLEGVTNDGELGALDSAGVIGFYANYEGGPKNEIALFGEPAFQELEAVKAGRMVPLPDFLPQGYGDALALLAQLEGGLEKLGAGA